MLKLAPQARAAPSYDPQAAHDADALDCVIVGGPSEAVVVPEVGHRSGYRLGERCIACAAGGGTHDRYC